MLQKEVYFRFERPREFQDRLMNDIYSAIELQQHILCHAPLGIGKTDASLSPAISYAMKNNKNVFFLTPKISQHEIAVNVVKDLSEKHRLNLNAVDLVGKKYMCLDHIVSQAEGDGFYQMCSKKKEREQCQFFANFPGYDNKQKQSARLHFEKFSKEFNSILSHHELIKNAENYKLKGFERPMCPYEVSMSLAKKCNIIIADYYYIFSPSVNEIVFPKIKKKLSNSIIIIDEAHNLPERVRKLMSSSLSTFSLKKAWEEMMKINQKELAYEIREIEKTIRKLGKEMLGENAKECLIAKHKFSDSLKTTVGKTSDFSSALRDASTEYLEASNKNHSFANSIVQFLEKWELDLESNIRILKRYANNKEFAINFKSLDASPITKGIFEEAYASVLLSGTLLPTEMYADLLGIQKERAIFKEYPNPFPADNRLNLIVPSVTTKYSERKHDEFQRIANELTKIINKVPGNSAIFFSSFNMLESIYPYLYPQISREIIRQQAKMKSHDVALMLDRFRNAANSFGAVLMAVCSGSFSEGIDLPGNQLLCAIIVGVPLQELNLETKCLIDYYEEKFGRGWHYAYLYPAVNRSLQAAGRVIRTHEDKGITVFMDKRFVWENYRRCFPKDLSAIVTHEAEKYVENFWANNGKFLKKAEEG